MLRHLVWIFLVACTHAPKVSLSQLQFVRCGRLIDGVHAEARTNIDVIIENERIVALGSELTKPPGALVVDLREFTCLPGLIDMHTHLSALPEDNADLRAHALMSREKIRQRERDNARTMLFAGFTSVRDIGTYHAWINRELRNEIQNGLTIGPRVQFAPYYLTIPKGGGDLSFEDVTVPPELHMGVARGVEQFRLKAQQAVDGGADVLKVIASGAVLAYGSEPGQPEMTFDEIRAVVEVGHQAGRKVSAHAHGARSIKDAILAGVDTIEHASLIDEEGLRLAKKYKVALVMDIFNGDYIDSKGLRAGWPQEFLKKNREITELQRGNFAKAYQLGVPLLYGSDAGVYPNSEIAKQFQTMVARGMKPMHAIQSATSLAARYMGWENSVGTLAPGFYADLIAVQGNPLIDIRVLQEKVAFVMKGGHTVRNNGSSTQSFTTQQLR